MIYILGTLFFIGVHITGAEGPYFPWPNMGGIVICGAIGIVAILKREP